LEKFPTADFVVVGVGGRERVAVLDVSARPGAVAFTGNVADSEITRILTVEDGVVSGAVNCFNLESVNVIDINGFNELPDHVVVVGGFADSTRDGIHASEEIFIFIANVVIRKVGVAQFEHTAGQLGDVFRFLGVLLVGQVVPNILAVVLIGTDVLAKGLIDTLEDNAYITSQIGELENVGEVSIGVSSFHPVVALQGELIVSVFHPPFIVGDKHLKVVGVLGDIPGSENFCLNIVFNGVEQSAVVTAVCGFLAGKDSH
jgi:hypothetical protein